MVRVVGGRYELQELVGAGSFGSVWASWDRRSREWVAVKQCKDPGEEALLRFLREQRLVLAHPNLCAPIDSGFEGDQPYLVLPLVRGGTLAEHLAEDGPLEPAAVGELVAQLHGALAQLHAHGIVHRDVQPSNILLEATPADGGVLRAYLTDFGYALKLGSSRLSTTDLVAGTAGYRAPEVCRGHDATPASDLYSLAVVAYEAATGLRIAHESEQHPPSSAALFAEPSELALASLPVELASYVETNLSLDPTLRSAQPPALTGDATVTVLARVLTDRKHPADGRRRALSVAAVCIAVVLAVGGLVVYTSRAADPVPSAEAGSPMDGSDASQSTSRPTESTGASGSTGTVTTEPGTTTALPGPSSTTSAVSTSTPDLTTETVLPGTSAPLPPTAPSTVPATTIEAPFPTDPSAAAVAKAAREREQAVQYVHSQGASIMEVAGFQGRSTLDAILARQASGVARVYFFHAGKLVGPDAAVWADMTTTGVESTDRDEITVFYENENENSSGSIPWRWTGSRVIAPGS